MEPMKYAVEYEDPWWVLMYLDEWGQIYDAEYFATKDELEQYLEMCFSEE
jgi:hypothetical protein